MNEDLLSIAVCALFMHDSFQSWSYFKIDFAVLATITTYVSGKISAALRW